MRDPVTTDLGGIGEATIKQWAHEVGISPNPASHDVKGYDYFLILPRPSANTDPVDPLDLEPPELSCLVQVKTTRDAQRPIKVALSNWERLAKSPLPAFYLVFEVGQTNKVQRAFLVHIGREWVTKVLKRLRQARPGERHRLHHCSMTLGLRPDETLPSLDGTALLAGLRASIGLDAGAYFLAKKNWVETVGYDRYRYHATFTFGVSEPDALHGMMADFAIGQLSRLPIAVSRIREFRFGVPADVKGGKDPSEGFLQLPKIPSFMELPIEASDEQGLEVVSLRCKAYAAATIFPFLPPEHRKIALKADNVTLVFAPAKSLEISRQASATFHLPSPTEVRTIGGALSAAKLLRMAHRGAIHLTAIHEGKSIKLGRLPMQWTDSRLPRTVLDYATAIENAAIVMATFGVPSETKFAFGTLGRQAQTLQILAAAGRSGVTVTTSVTLDRSRAVDQSAKRAAVVNVQWVVFGDCALLVIPAIVGEPSWEETTEHELRMTVNARAIQPRAVRVLSAAQAPRFNARPLLEKVYQELEAEGVEIVVQPPPGKGRR
jgi:hypothetical protein